ncbi:3-methyl-2-oxobutanoate hydroxymethyltransferase [Cypionkella aquatica]|uniref:3-methyl-2-oxobutanoate hydroxymethyltransferase n=1 Tax=Cypionkella aquatica TaxID=1756042 RepID=A0AA37U530_9RHOB|nr:3-methyl-2-oxobutanoate hydroxymethyltransferase [Cypionkella aquatica]GLS85841.1 3-methyl-2-oxobutanoate hydroxymethyltransferase [Cypionkella aquatica]
MRPTVADIRALKGKRQITMLYVITPEEAAAAAAAHIDMLSIEARYWSPAMRAAAGDCFVQIGLPYRELVTSEDYLRAAHKAMQSGGDCVYCAASLATVRALADEGIPVVGHLGLIPSKCTWTGGFKAVGKTSAGALALWQQAVALEAAGAFAAELEVVPDRVAAELSKRSSLIMLGMGAGPGADAQYLFAEDVLGYTRGHRPRHAKTYRDFAAENDRLQAERIAAFNEFRSDVESRDYPAAQHVVPILDAEFAAFMAKLP